MRLACRFRTEGEMKNYQLKQIIELLKDLNYI